MRFPRPALPLLLLLVPTSAGADFTATGVCLYRDREFGETGFTGVEPSRPIRFADVEVLDNNLNGTKAILATGSTDASGGFSLFVPDTKVRNIVVRCLTSTTHTTAYYLSTTNLASNPSVYAIVSPVFPSHAPNVNLNVGSLLAVPGSGGEPFNLFDAALDALDYLGFLNGAPPGPTRPLRLKWEANTGSPGSAFDLSTAAVTVGDESAYDDTIVLHEIGHYAVFHYSDRDSPGGLHRLSDCNQDIRLAFDEGHASFFGNSVRRWKGYPRPEIYVNTNGMPGQGNLDFYFNLETETPFSCDGSTSEVSVYTALWDIADGPATPDATPGSDEPFDLLAQDDREVWQVMTIHLPTALSISLEDFWDGWFSPGILNGFGEEMIAVFDNLTIEFYPDPLEANGTAATARPVGVTGLLYHNTFFSDPESDYRGAADTDYFSFSAISGGQYAIETLNLLSDANTYLRLRGTNGTTVLAENNDRTAGDPSSLITFTPASNGVYFVEAFHAADFGVYGSYDFRITVQGGPDQDADSFDISVDCNDQNPAVNPGAAEICNGVDDDCDGLTDEDFDQDADRVTVCQGDCDDNDTLNFPGNPEICDRRDNDCDLILDEGFDQDGDGFSTCALPVGDCADSDPAISPAAAEGPMGSPACSDGQDNDCDAGVDNQDAGCQAPPCPDADGDGVADCASNPTCDPAGLPCGDCDDADPLEAPGNPEVCDGRDNDCDGAVDEGFDGDLDGFTSCGGDCDDADPAVHPGAAEGPPADPSCSDLRDNDCDGDADGLDGGCLSCPDADGDGAADCAAEPTCDPAGLPCGDCDDADAAVRPGLAESCDGRDNDCDGAVDTGFPDTDGDGIRDCVDPDDDNDAAPDGSDCAPLVSSISQVPGNIGPTLNVGPGSDRIAWYKAPQSNVSNVYRGSRSPGVPFAYNHGCAEAESPDPLAFDAGMPPPGVVYYYLVSPRNACGEGTVGSDSSGFPRPLPFPCGPMGADSDGDGVADLNDNCPLAPNPGQGDSDLDGVGGVCDNCPIPNPSQADGDGNGIGDVCDDADGDGFVAAADCDDGDPAAHPGAAEPCNGRDDDCDGLTDEGFNQDGDPFTSCGGDCNDADPAIHPAAGEGPLGDPSCSDLRDNDCDNTVDASDLNCQPGT